MIGQPETWEIRNLNSGSRSIIFAGQYTWEEALKHIQSLTDIYPQTRYEPVKVGSEAKLSDVKAALNSGVKPDITHVRTPVMNYTARNQEYGEAKYRDRGNFLRSTTGHADDFNRLRSYIRALVSHAIKALDSMENHQAQDPKLEDWEGMKKAAYAADTDPGNDLVGPSLLPHLGGTAASLNMALAQAVNADLLPADPGQPWVKK